MCACEEHGARSCGDLDARLDSIVRSPLSFAMPARRLVSLARSILLVFCSCQILAMSIADLRHCDATTHHVLNTGWVGKRSQEGQKLSFFGNRFRSRHCHWRRAWLRT